VSSDDQPATGSGGAAAPESAVGESAPTGESEQSLTAESSQPLVEVSELKTHYETRGALSGPPVKAVDGVSFEIARGETLGLVGESGCGKTTLGRTIARLEKPTAGTVSFEGVDVTTLSGRDLREWRQRVGFVFQDPDSSLNKRLTVGEIVREPLDVHDWGTDEECETRVRDLLDVVGLREEHYYRYPHQFSGGQKQRVGIARALALEPEFVVLDEPVSALDVSVQAQVLNLLADLQAEFGLTYLFIAHDLAVVRHICDRVAVMYLGNLMELGETERLFTDPANPYTRSLLSAIPEPDPTADDDRITLSGTPPSPQHPPTGCPFVTRCPVVVRPPEFRELDDEVWERVAAFREVLRERSRADRSLRETVRELFGLDTRFSDVSEVAEELFADVDAPAEVREVVDEATQRVETGTPEAGNEYLEAQFGAVCDEEHPAAHTVDDAGRTSHCHRHGDEHAPPAEVE
jgi:peptide/nickel transport system ATP-binding protein